MSDATLAQLHSEPWRELAQRIPPECVSVFEARMIARLGDQVDISIGQFAILRRIAARAAAATSYCGDSGFAANLKSETPPLPWPGGRGF